MNTEELINSIDFGNSPDKDMTAPEMKYIKESNEAKLGHIDLADVMYDAYRLGFAKALISTGIRVKDFDKLGLAGKDE